MGWRLFPGLLYWFAPSGFGGWGLKVGLDNGDFLVGQAVELIDEVVDLFFELVDGGIGGLEVHDLIADLGLTYGVQRV